MPSAKSILAENSDALIDISPTLFAQILSYHKTSLVGRCFLFTAERWGQVNEVLFCQNHKPQEWMVCREGWTVPWGTFYTCWSSLINVFYPFCHSKPRTLLQILGFHWITYRRKGHNLRPDVSIFQHFHSLPSSEKLLKQFNTAACVIITYFLAM